jgi:hypothetical protein
MLSSRKPIVFFRKDKTRQLPFLGSAMQGAFQDDLEAVILAVNTPPIAFTMSFSP